MDRSEKEQDSIARVTAQMDLIMNDLAAVVEEITMRLKRGGK